MRVRVCLSVPDRYFDPAIPVARIEVPDEYIQEPEVEVEPLPVDGQ